MSTGYNLQESHRRNLVNRALFTDLFMLISSLVQCHLIRSGNLLPHTAAHIGRHVKHNSTYTGLERKMSERNGRVGVLLCSSFIFSCTPTFIGLGPPHMRSPWDFIYFLLLAFRMRLPFSHTGGSLWFPRYSRHGSIASAVDSSFRCLRLGVVHASRGHLSHGRHCHNRLDSLNSLPRRFVLPCNYEYETVSPIHHGLRESQVRRSVRSR